MNPGMHTPVVDGHNVLNLKKIGEMVLVDGLILTYTSGVLESMTSQIEDFIPPDHTRANYAGLVLHGAHR